MPSLERCSRSSASATGRRGRQTASPARLRRPPDLRPTNTSPACSLPDPNTIFDPALRTDGNGGNRPDVLAILSSVVLRRFERRSTQGQRLGDWTTRDWTRRAGGWRLLPVRAVHTFRDPEVLVKLQAAAQLVCVIARCAAPGAASSSGRKSGARSRVFERAATGCVSPVRSTSVTSFSSDSNPVPC